VLAKLAEVRGTTLDELARITSDNANTLFGLPR
jgi:Tat protein secretion system quality control protein TatD with DNase activity